MFSTCFVVIGCVLCLLGCFQAQTFYYCKLLKMHVIFPVTAVFPFRFHLFVCVIMGVHVHVCFCFFGLADHKVAVIPQIVEDVLAKVWPCHSCSPPWRGSRAHPIWPQVLTLTNTDQSMTEHDESFVQRLKSPPRIHFWSEHEGHSNSTFGFTHISEHFGLTKKLQLPRWAQLINALIIIIICCFIIVIIINCLLYFENQPVSDT